jgi:hypothetical protein
MASTLDAGVTAIETSVAGVTVTRVDAVRPPKAAVTALRPTASVVATPAFVIVRTRVSLELHMTVAVRSAMEPSAYVPVARNGIVTPTPTTGIVGVTAIETSGAGVTVRVAAPETIKTVARIVVVPGPTPRATPVVEIVAAAPLVEVQVADVVTSWVVPSLSVATAA